MLCDVRVILLLDLQVCLGQILEGVALLLNQIWFTELRLEYLWLTNVYDLMGGQSSSLL